MSGHVSVLMEEAVGALLSAPVRERNADAPLLWLDGTFGRGGHAAALLSALPATDQLHVIDRDPEALEVARGMASGDGRLIVHAGEWNDVISSFGEGTFAGILLDLGVSSPQLDTAERGFSFALDGPLDMRMDTGAPTSAAGWLNTASEADIAQVLWDYGEERFARRIARAIVAARPLHRTLELSEVVSRAVPAAARRKGKHDATRTFQAVRIHVNDELAGLERALPRFFEGLHEGGRLAVITFHSLEDRLVKRYFKRCSTPPEIPRRLPVRAESVQPPARLVGRAQTPNEAELAVNPRARSARLRVLERAS